MKKIILISLLLTIITSNLFAACETNGIWVFPRNGEIKQNSWFMIEGYAESQEIISNLNSKYTIYLESGKHKVKLIIVSKHIGMFDVTQVILKPEELLKKGETYFLKINNLNEEQQQNFGKWVQGKIEAFSWKVKKGTDKQKPAWEQEPNFIKSEIEWFGCGPGMYAVFECAISDKSETLVKTELTDLNTKETNSYYLITEGNILKVGHGMCSGAFTFKENHKYKVQFSLLDASGNELTEYTKVIEFDSPYKVFKIEDNINNSEAFPIEGVNDIKGEYINSEKTERWAIYFDEKLNDFVAWHCYLNKGKEDCKDPLIIEKVEKNTAKGSYHVKIKGISGEMTPTWSIIYNEEKRYYDLHTHSYDAENDKWINMVFNGNDDNG